MLKNGQEVPLSTTSSIVSIVDVTKVTRSGRVSGPVFPKSVEDVSVSKKVDVPVVGPVSTPRRHSGESSGLKLNDNDEGLALGQKAIAEKVEKIEKWLLAEKVQGKAPPSEVTNPSGSVVEEPSGSGPLKEEVNSSGVPVKKERGKDRYHPYAAAVTVPVGIPCEALDLNHLMDASASACPNQGYSLKGVSTPLSKMYPSPKVEQHSEKYDDSSSYEKDMAAEGLCSLGKTVSGKGKFVASKIANASYSEKHDVANDVIDLKDDRSDDQKDILLHHLKPSVAKRIKTRKGRFVAELMSARTAKKTAGVDVPDISPVKKTPVEKSHVKVAAVHLDNISFHLEDGAAKWKFVIQRRVAVERELGKDVVEVKEVMDLIKTVGLMKTVVGFSQCYEVLVKEFIVNIPKDIAYKNSKEFCKVFVRGKCITFSPTVINNFLGRRVEGVGELEATDNKVCREITARQVKGWPIKKLLPAGKLTVKYAILHKIGAANWVPTNHISTIDNTLGRFIFVVGTKMKFDYGSHVEDIVMTSAMKKPASKVGTIAELKETCKELGEGIRLAYS
ncbi:uncharacterized protein LOC127131242 [Lathyrus oleraceus]|uniref:uncharacterized protein LOC127131242 n=1 Tax=Pisum sativum TaxID=3888 RepID=UPI0021D269A0|nr:uncharacterized protein LOC127131242 [Pisum sativum]